MVLDIITAALIVIPMGIGMARGAGYIAARALGWIGALAASFFAHPFVSRWMGDGPVGKMVYSSLEERFSGPVGDVETATQGLPQIIRGGITSAAQDTADALVQSIGGLIISVVSFVTVVILLRLFAALIIRHSSRRRRDKDSRIFLLTRMNKVLGLIIGGLEGLLLAWLFLAALIPVVNMGSSEFSLSVTDGLRYSYLAGPLYDGNLLLVITSMNWFGG